MPSNQPFGKSVFTWVTYVAYYRIMIVLAKITHLHQDLLTRIFS
jgi:hypothetical protein